MKLAVLVCLFFGLNYAMQLGKSIMPFDLRRAMDNVTSLDSFVQAMSLKKGLIESLRDFVSSLNEGRNVTAPSLGRKTIMNNRLPLIALENAECKIRPVAIEVPQPDDQYALYFPFFVTLHRCGGACTRRPFETKCQVKESEDLNLLVHRVAWTSPTDKVHDLQKEIVFVRITNHTKCGCECSIKEKDCDNRTETYNKETCRCECKRRGIPCPFRFFWDPVKCGCQCDLTNKQRCKKRYKFDEKLCTCVCSSKRCKMSNKVRDPRDCRCKCPRLVCPRGMWHDRRICQCIGKRQRRLL